MTTSRRRPGRFACFWLAILALALPQSARGAIEVSMDFAHFRYDSLQVYTEVYYSIALSGLKLIDAGGARQAEVKVTIEITKDGTIWKMDGWRMQETLAGGAEPVPGSTMVDMVNYLLEPGDYLFKLSVADLNEPDNQVEAETALSVVPFPQDKLVLSDIQLASSIRQLEQNQENPFCKNGLEVIPMPGSLYGTKTPMLFYYLEAYNLNAAVAGKVYKIRCRVTDSNGQALDKIQPRHQVKTVVESAVEVGAVNVHALPSGVYNLQIAILDSDERLLQEKAKKFYVYNPDVQAVPRLAPANAEAAFAVSEFAAMKASALEQEFKMVKYIATREEQVAFQSLKDERARQQFLFEFWGKRDPSPATTANEFRIEYLRRIEYANENFRSFSRKGWQTDRGRVSILYGRPNDIERFPNNSRSYTYQVWHYDNIEGGVIFVFADLQEFGEYMQLHSTKRGEPHNENWEEIIHKNL